MKLVLLAAMLLLSACCPCIEYNERLEDHERALYQIKARMYSMDSVQKAMEKDMKYGPYSPFNMEE